LSGTFSSLGNRPHRDRQRWGRTSGEIHGGLFQCHVAVRLLETPPCSAAGKERPTERSRRRKSRCADRDLFLGLAIRDRSSASGLLGSSTISAAAAVVAGVVDRLSNRANARLHDRVVISAYASTIVAMLIYLACERRCSSRPRFGTRNTASGGKSSPSPVSSPMLRWSSFRLSGTVPGSAGAR